MDLKYWDNKIHSGQTLGCSERTRSIRWLVMSWFNELPGYQPHYSRGIFLCSLGVTLNKLGYILLTRINFDPSNHTNYKIWDDIIYPLCNAMLGPSMANGTMLHIGGHFLLSGRYTVLRCELWQYYCCQTLCGLETFRKCLPVLTICAVPE